METSGDHSYITPQIQSCLPFNIGESCDYPLMIT